MRMSRQPPPQEHYIHDLLLDNTKHGSKYPSLYPLSTCAVMSTELLFGTLGMFIIDTFKYIDALTGQDLGDQGRGERIGGGGTYATIGARIWLSPEQLIMVIDRGIDFQSDWQRTLDEFASCADEKSKTHAHALWKYRDRTVHDDTGTGEQGSQLTTKARNVYYGEKRDFEYLTPRLRLNPIDLILSPDTPSLPKWIHCVCSPKRVMEIHQHIRAINDTTKICWEPLDMTATPENLRDTLIAMQYIDVFSPNHEEAASFLSVPHTSIALPPSDQMTLQSATHIRSIHAVTLAQEFQNRFNQLHNNTPSCPLIVIRCGAAGSIALNTHGITASIPSYHLLASTQKDVKDVTGGGNSFLGGLIAFLAPQDDMPDKETTLTQALVQGAVSASFAIEQLGLPTYDHSANTWNGQTAEERLEVYQKIM
ncbi:unnamed protein product [Sympodiomycopsis kandeliae]